VSSNSGTVSRFGLGSASGPTDWIELETAEAYVSFVNADGSVEGATWEARPPGCSSARTPQGGSTCVSAKPACSCPPFRSQRSGGRGRWIRVDSRSRRPFPAAGLKDRPTVESWPNGLRDCRRFLAS
jgi:hypothetical protein